MDETETGFLRRRGLAWRLAATYVLTTLIALVGLGLVIYFVTDFYLDQRLEQDLAAQARFHASYAASIASNEITFAALAPTIVDRFAVQSDITVRFFAADSGALLAASQDLGSQPSRAALAELSYRSAALFTPAARDLPGRRYAAQPVVMGGRTIGVVEVSRSTLAGERFLVTLRWILLAATWAAGVGSLLVSALLARWLSGPIRDVERAARRVAAGDLSVRLGQYPPQELNRLAQSINHMAAKLEALESARAQFIGEVSHDLRTPLTAIKGLLANLVDTAGPTAQPSLALAEREADRLIRLVNQLLDFSRWQGGRLTLDRHPVDVGALARETVALSEGQARHRDVRLEADVPPGLPRACADPDRLQRAMFNLLDNAIRFTPGGGRVVLTLAQRPGEIEIGVEDTGRGMSREEQERAFEPYYRGQGGGAGLGLAIARAVVEAHGGHMGIESAPGAGTRVWFTLPV